MSNDPFKPPKTDVDEKPSAPGSPLRAVLTGLVVDIGGSMVLGILVEVVYRVHLSAAGLSSDQIDDALTNLAPDSAVAVLGTLLGSACSVAGGYVCARIVRRDEYRVGGVMASLSALFGLLFGSPSTPDDLIVLFTLCTVACVLLGAKYGREYNQRTDPPPASPPGAPRP